MNSHRIVDGYCFDCEGGCILELAEDNERLMRLGPSNKLKPHAWDEWGLNERAVPSQMEDRP